MVGCERWVTAAVLSLSLLALTSGLATTARAADAVPIWSAAQTAQATQTGAMAEAGDTGGAKTCLKCHDEPPATLILHTRHAQMGDPRTPFAKQQCQACHGASEAHLEKPPEGQKRALPDVVFGQRSPTPVAKQNAVCIGCHEGGLRMHWAGSEHAAADVACTACHEAHVIKDKVLVKNSQPQVCFDCHHEQRAQSLKRSRHPIKEGKVVCSDCHNPHGSFGPTLLVKNTVNQTCFQCHAEKRGPFLWEHAPVTDSCTTCHTPHGSAQPRLLKVRTPFLCQMCHSETFHPSTLYGGQFLPPSTSASAARLLAKGCQNCHPMVHGTNHPSGARLTR
jgi:DmsE family decaheme c-type cytochrome